MKISSEEIYRRLEEYFRPWECTDVFPKIGLQLHCCDFPQKVYTATFASDEVFTFLKEKGVKNALLFTHHPAPQKTDLNLPAPPVSQENIDFMKENGISFFSYHIPLDRNSPYAPGFNLAKAMGAEPYAEFYEQNGVKMGLLCRFEAETLEDVKNALENAIGHKAKIYHYGDSKVKKDTVAIMAGGASNRDIYAYLEKIGVNVFITGVTNRSVSWVDEVHSQAEAHGINIIGGTHLSTEQFAPMAMTGFFKKLGLEAEFIKETPNFNEL